MGYFAQHFGWRQCPSQGVKKKGTVIFRGPGNQPLDQPNNQCMCRPLLGSKVFVLFMLSQEENDTGGLSGNSLK